MNVRFGGISGKKTPLNGAGDTPETLRDSVDCAFWKQYVIRVQTVIIVT